MARLFRISALSDGTLLHLIAAMKQWDRETRKQIRQHTRSMVQEVWAQTMDERASTRLERAVLARSARTAVSDQNVTLRAATSRRTLTGGLRPKDNWHAVEFGANHFRQRFQVQTHQVKRGGRTFTRKGHTITRTSGQQFKPPNRKGYVFYPAAARIIPRVASLWVQTAVRTFHELREGANRG